VAWFLYLGGAAFLVALVSAMLVATSARRYEVVLLSGLALAAVAGAYGLYRLTAGSAYPYDPNEPNCDCHIVWGRGTWLTLVLGLNLVAWLLGATAGWLGRQALSRHMSRGAPGL